MMPFARPPLSAGAPGASSMSGGTGVPPRPTSGAPMAPPFAARPPAMPAMPATGAPRSASPPPSAAQRIAPATPAPAVRMPTPASVPRATPAGTPTARPPINPFLANDPNAKAKRLARALVSDIVTYFPQKRDEGLRDGTLKQLFREEIKKSYEEYIEQIGREFADGTTHFQDALNDILAGGKKLF
jgi:hypothetical protein